MYERKQKSVMINYIILKVAALVGICVDQALWVGLPCPH
jgi:hypothetical protein